jgi:hypothetical protein
MYEYEDTNHVDEQLFTGNDAEEVWEFAIEGDDLLRQLG